MIRKIHLVAAATAAVLCAACDTHIDVPDNGQSAYVPSVAEMRLLYTMREIVNPVIEQCGGEPLPLDENDCWYWTSTEVEKQQTAKAWLYSMGSGAMQETPKVQAHRVRPIITINE